MLRNSWILYAISVFLCCFVWILDLLTPAFSLKLKEEECQNLVFASLSGSNLNEVVFSSGNYCLSIQRSIMGWHSSYRIRKKTIIEDQADDIQMREMMDDLSSLRIEEKQHIEKGSLWNSYGLGDLGSSSFVDSIQVNYGSITQRLFLGIALRKENSFYIYARMDGSDDLLLLDGKIQRWIKNIQNNPDCMRSKRVFGFQGTPEKVFWQNASGEKCIFWLEKGQWYLTDNQGFKDRANFVVLEKFLKWMKECTVQRFLYEPCPDTKEFGPFVMAGYQDGGKEEYFLMGKTVIREQKEFLHCARAYFQGEAIKIAYTYLISKLYGEAMPGEIDMFREPQAISIFKDSIKSILREGQISWQLNRAEKDKWHLSLPQEKEVPSKRVEVFLERIFSLKSKKFIKESLQKKAQNRLTLVLEKGDRQVFSWYDFSSDEMAIYQEGYDVGRILPSYQSPLQENHFAFYNNRIDAFSFSEVFAIKIHKSDTLQAFEKKEGVWWCVYPGLHLAEKDAVEDILRHCAWIMARGVLGEGESARKKFLCGEKYSLEIASLSPEKEKKVCTIELGEEVEKGFFALWVSGFPYIYKIPDNLKQSIDKIGKPFKQE
ncbi:MAG: hypothetical protein HUU50_06245 [Candidatus Brocadiae bacterium]|nr:hypothetical protein [Candidatus Brocadiia bacterium]